MANCFVAHVYACKQADKIELGMQTKGSKQKATNEFEVFKTANIIIIQTNESYI